MAENYVETPYNMEEIISNVITEKEACKTHNKIGKIVRKAIKEAGRNYARRFTNS